MQVFVCQLVPYWLTAMTQKPECLSRKSVRGEGPDQIHAGKPGYHEWVVAFVA